MPFGNTKDTKMLGKVVLAIAGLLLLFGTIPILGIGIATPIISGVNFGTIIGVVVLYVTYLLHKNKI